MDAISYRLLPPPTPNDPNLSDDDLPTYIPQPDSMDLTHHPIPLEQEIHYFSLTILAREAGKSWAQIERIIREDLGCPHYTASYGRWRNFDAVVYGDSSYSQAKTEIGIDGYHTPLTKLLIWRLCINPNAKIH